MRQLACVSCLSPSCESPGRATAVTVTDSVTHAASALNPESCAYAALRASCTPQQTQAPSPLLRYPQVSQRDPNIAMSRRIAHARSHHAQPPARRRRHRRPHARPDAGARRRHRLRHLRLRPPRAPARRQADRRRARGRHREVTAEQSAFAMDLKKDVVMGHEFSARVTARRPRRHQRRARRCRRLDARAWPSARPSPPSATATPSTAATPSASCSSRRCSCKVPEGLDPRHAALTEPMAVGLHAVAKSGIKPGDTALVLGAGPVGLAVIAGAAARRHRLDRRQRLLARPPQARRAHGRARHRRPARDPRDRGVTQGRRREAARHLRGRRRPRHARRRHEGRAARRPHPRRRRLHGGRRRSSRRWASTRS